MDRASIATTSSVVAIALSGIATTGAIALPRVEARHQPSGTGTLRLWLGPAMTKTGSDGGVVVSLPASPTPQLADGDVVVLSEADIAMLEYAVSADLDDLDYSAFYDES